ncbi:MAG: anthrone oxygenase family protein [Planctomycetota bacterium]|jgi:uncharacterized membrane protein
METQQLLALAGLLGSALVAGTLFAFSTFIMPALGQLAPAEGMRAMQRINVTVFHPLFMGTFFGTALVSLAALVLPWITGADQPAWSWTGPALYLVGVFGVTAAGNVPLNERLQDADSQQDSGRALWAGYQTPWTRWNHLRTLASIAAMAAFGLSAAA